MAENRQRGLLRLATGLEMADAIRPETSHAAFAVPSSGAAEALSSVAGEFAKIGEKVSRLADHAAKVEGAEAGHLAGLDPEFRPEKLRTIRGEAFDAAGLQTYLAKSKVAIENEIEQTHLTLQAQPQKLMGVLAEKKSAWLAKAPEDLRPEIANVFDRGAFAAARSATRELWARQAAEAQGAQQDALQRQMRTMHQMAFGAGMDPQADDVLAAQYRDIQKTLGMRGPNGQPLVSPAAAQRLLANAREEVATARITGAFQRLPSIEAKQQFLGQLEEDFASGKGFAKDYDLPTFKQVSNQLRVELNRDLVMRRAGIGELEQQLKAAAKLTQQGDDLDPALRAELKARVATQAPELKPVFEAMERNAAYVRELRQMPLGKIDGEVRSIKAAIGKYGNTPERQAYLEQAEGVQAAIRTGLKEDPLGWAEKIKLVAQLPDLDFANPEAMRNRIAVAEQVAAHYGEKPRYLRPHEKHALEARLAEGGDSAIKVAAAIAGNAPERAQHIFGELDKQHAGSLAQLGLLVSDRADPTFIRQAANGMAFFRLPEKKPVSDLKRADIDPVFDSVLGTALGGHGAARNAVLALANYAYEMEAQAKGYTTFQKDAYERLLRQAVGEKVVGGEMYGGIARVNGGLFSRGHAVLVPPNVKQSGMLELLAAIELDDLSAGGATPPRHEHGKIATLAEIDDAVPIQAGPSRYFLQVGSGPLGEPRVLLGDNNQPYVLDLKRLEPVLRKRRPDLYLGGAP